MHRGVASVAIRSLAIAAEALVSRREQEEVLQIFEKIKKETGWRVGFLNKELKDKWGWNDDAFQQPPPQQMPAALMHNPPMQSFQFQQQSSSLPPTPPSVLGMPRPGIVNPLMRTADFSAPTHPYQNYYVAPNHHQQQPNHSYY